MWTVSAEQGTGGDRLSASLAAAADVALWDRDALALLAGELNPEVTGGAQIDELEESAGRGGISLLALGIPFSPIAGELVRQINLQHALPDLGRAVTCRAAREPSVIFASGAFAALESHASAVHVRLRAPFAWRVDRFSHTHVASHRCAEKAVREDDHRKHAWLRSIYHVDLHDPLHFSLVLDVSRFSHERLIETLLAAGGVALAPAIAAA